MRERSISGLEAEVSLGAVVSRGIDFLAEGDSGEREREGKGGECVV